MEWSSGREADLQTSRIDAPLPHTYPHPHHPHCLPSVVASPIFIMDDPISTVAVNPLPDEEAYHLRSRRVQKTNVPHRFGKRPASPQIWTRKELSWKESTTRHMDMYDSLARQALAYYNSKEHADFVFVEVLVAAWRCGPRRTVHLNFAASRDGSDSLFFSELASMGSDTFHVKGCSLLEKIDSGNPLGMCCSLCRKEVIHPGPRDGYMVSGGDDFSGYPFWGYRSTSSTEPTPDNMKLYLACAMITLEHYNSVQHTDFTATESVRGAHSVRGHRIIVHISFEISGAEQDLLFAELIVPIFTVDDMNWDDRKRPFVELNGYCLLKKIDSGKPFGRVCGVCFDGKVIHPGPREGYSITAGDDFAGYDFMDIGRGIY